MCASLLLVNGKNFCGALPLWRNVGQSVNGSSRQSATQEQLLEEPVPLKEEVLPPRYPSKKRSSSKGKGGAKTKPPKAPTSPVHSTSPVLEEAIRSIHVWAMKSHSLSLCFTWVSFNVVMKMQARKRDHLSQYCTHAIYPVVWLTKLVLCVLLETVSTNLVWCCFFKVGTVSVDYSC